MQSTEATVDRGLLAIFQALGDENRLRVVETLRGGERCVCELQADLGMAQSLLSHHLRVLREAGLVRDRRDGRWVHYSLRPETLEALGSYLGTVHADAATATGSSVSLCAP